ncbi:hypothetical protein FN846DRAFT_914547 [Sphaerosporella brunnea]|uniref:Uncharacterized protein n=1 Tax=Sphaerosporella brunnea TaxID=1250544 RepID=A0A5J5ECS9_9PEZI|nr:hypothetical protein FN846DRAFT_914547 [Sphaerosporella brunnea]
MDAVMKKMLLIAPPDTQTITALTQPASDASDAPVPTATAAPITTAHDASVASAATAIAVPVAPRCVSRIEAPIKDTARTGRDRLTVTLRKQAEVHCQHLQATIGTLMARIADLEHVSKLPQSASASAATQIISQSDADALRAAKATTKAPNATKAAASPAILQRETAEPSQKTAAKATPALTTAARPNTYSAAVNHESDTSQNDRSWTTVGKDKQSAKTAAATATATVALKPAGHNFMIRAVNDALAAAKAPGFLRLMRHTQNKKGTVTTLAYLAATTSQICVFDDTILAVARHVDLRIIAVTPTEDWTHVKVHRVDAKSYVGRMEALKRDLMTDNDGLVTPVQIR